MTTNKLSMLPGDLDLADADRDWFRVTVRGTGKTHRAYATSKGAIYGMACSCPGSQNGHLARKCRLVSNGWTDSRCDN